MKSQTIKAIFTNLLFVIGVILLIFGFIRGSITITRLVIFDKYPLQSYEETRCQIDLLPQPVSTDGKTQLLSQKESQGRQEKCTTSLEHERKVRQTEDIVYSVTTLVAGFVLIVAFKRFIFSES